MAFQGEDSMISKELTFEEFKEYVDRIDKQYKKVREEERLKNEALEANEDANVIPDEVADEGIYEASLQVNKENIEPLCNIEKTVEDVSIKMDNLKSHRLTNLDNDPKPSSLVNCLPNANIRKQSPNLNNNETADMQEKPNEVSKSFSESAHTDHAQVGVNTGKSRKVLPTAAENVTPLRMLLPPKMPHSLPTLSVANTNNIQGPKVLYTTDMRSHLNTPIYQTFTNKKARRPLLTTMECMPEDDDQPLIGDDAKDIQLKPLPEQQIKDVFRSIKVNDVYYLVLNELGKGGSSMVFHCYDPQTKEECAIKVVDLAQDPNGSVGFINEVQALRRLRHCDRIIRLHQSQVSNDGKKLYMVLEKGGRDFAQILNEHDKNTAHHLPAFMVHFYWMQMLHAVRQIHSKGVIHSDLKPANFIEIRDRLKLIDFGIASCVQMDATSVFRKVGLGTFGYISPEALCNHRGGPGGDAGDQPTYKVGFKSDVWSMGCILYQLVYKRTPFAHIQRSAARLVTLMDPNHVIAYPEADWVPSGVIECIKVCLRYNARRRPSVDDLIRAEHAMMSS